MQATAKKSVATAAMIDLAFVPARFRKANMVETGREGLLVFAICYLLSNVPRRGSLRVCADIFVRTSGEELNSHWFRPSPVSKVLLSLVKVCKESVGICKKACGTRVLMQFAALAAAEAEEGENHFTTKVTKAELDSSVLCWVCYLAVSLIQREMAVTILRGAKRVD